ncbi:MAG: hypothetical protein ABIJ04_07150 [Bacteroidota bacterium]
MATEENDHNLAQRVRELFRDFEPEPPPRAWHAISTRLAGDHSGMRAQWNLNLLGGWLQPRYRLYPAITVVGLVLIALFIWMGVRPSHHIKGNAFADQEELSRGTAYLFRVDDREKPLDSVRFYGKRELDSTGHFSFRHVPSGAYLLRVHVHPDSPYSPAYHHGYYRDQLHWNQSTLIHTDHLQESYPVRVPKLTPE